MKPPVFVVGAPRSGSTLLYSMLLSSGHFAVFKAHTHIFDTVSPRFGDLANEGNRRKLLAVWLQTFEFSRSGLEPERFAARILKDCRSDGDFLRIFMEEIAEQQRVDRWAEHTPTHLLYLRDIKRAFPDAKIIHIIRDGRDVALSESRQGWVRPMPWDSAHRLTVSGLYWQWVVRRCRADGRGIAPDYMEVRFEELVENPVAVVAKVSNFIDQFLDYETMLRNAMGSLKLPNSSFAADPKRNGFQPVSRWKSELSREGLQALESAIGPLLVELGYQLATEDKENRATDAFTAMRLRTWYPFYFSSKFSLKSHTPLRRFSRITRLQDNTKAAQPPGPIGFL